MSLGAQMESLAEQIAASRAARRQTAAERAESVSVLRTATQQQVHAFRIQRADLAAMMHTELANGVQQRHSEVRRSLDEARQQLRDAGRVRRAEAVVMLSTLRAEAAERAELVKGTLQNWDVERRKAGQELMHALRAERTATTKALHKGLDEFREGLAESVRAKLSDSRSERVRAARAWAGLSATAGPAVAPEQFSAAADAADQPGEKDSATAGPAESPDQFLAIAEEHQGSADNVKARILAYVNAHPEGVKLTDIAAALELSRIQAGQFTRHLVDDSQIRKDDLLYLPAVNGSSES